MTFFDLFEPLVTGMRELRVSLKLMHDTDETRPTVTDEERKRVRRYIDEHPVGVIGIRAGRAADWD